IGCLVLVGKTAHDRTWLAYVGSVKLGGVKYRISTSIDLYNWKSLPTSVAATPGMLCGELGSRASPLSLHLACVTADTRSPYPALLALCRGAAMALTAAGPPPDDEDIFL
ncbi:Protein of unknown function, partial [Gryllus bimaculatus]